jgi:hypothetical protein
MDERNMVKANLFIANAITRPYGGITAQVALDVCAYDFAGDALAGLEPVPLW